MRFYSLEDTTKKTRKAIYQRKIYIANIIIKNYIELLLTNGESTNTETGKIGKHMNKSITEDS